MQNINLIRFLDTVADYYITAKDFPRSHSFRSAARKIELISFEIKEDNLAQVQFKGLGKSTLEEIKQFLKTGTSDRLNSLKQNNPPLSLLEQLSSLYDFDLQYINYLFRNFNIQSLKDLTSLNEVRVTTALTKQIDTTSSLDIHHPFKLIGDCSVRSFYSTGTQAIDSLVAKLAGLGDKHIFIADFYQGDNVLNGMNEGRFLSRLQATKQAQIDHGIKIFQGVVVDLDLDGNILCPPSILKQSEFIIISLSTRPHTNVITRVAKALATLPKESTMLDLFDKYVSFLDLQQLQSLINNYNPIVLFNPKALQVELAFLQKINIQRLALGSNANDFNQLNTIHQVGSLVHALGYTKNQIINCFAKPFKSQTSISNRIGTR